MASLSAYYPLPVVAGTTAGTYAEGNDSRIVGALPAATAGSGSVLASGSTTSRTLSDRFGEVFHVDDYGAVGDWNGTTGTDDTAAIQAAINAAVSAGGGIVRFGANKKYRLNTRSNRNTDTIGFNATNQRHFLRVGSGNLTSNFGSTSMMLYFEGNGATLHATEWSSNSNDIIYVCCQFHTIVFSDFKFTRNPYQITGTGNQSKAIAFYAADENEHEQVLIKNCYFNDNMASIDFSIWGPTTNWRNTLGKCKKVDVIDCIFKYDNGTSRVANKYTSGALVVYMCPWVLSANFERCHADGQTNGQTSLTYDEPMHGFLFPMPIRATVKNCYFTHFCVEVIKASDIETAQTHITINGDFTQVAVGSTLSRTIASNNNSSLVVGKIYCFYDPQVYDSKRGGFFKLEPKTGGGEYTFEVGETLNFTRVSSEPYQMISAREIQSGQSFSANNISLLDMELLERLSLDVRDCTFDSKPIKDYTGAELDNRVTWDSPSILCDYRCQIINNKFYGGYSNFYAGVSCGNFLSTLISINLFYKYTPRDEQIDGSFISCFSRKSNITIVNNTFVAKETRAVTYFIFVGGHEIIIRGNTAIVLSPSSLGENGVTLPTWFIAYDNGGVYRVVSEDNHLKDLENYGSSNDAGNVAHFIGSIRGQIQKPSYSSNPNAWAQSASQPFRMAKLFKSQDSSTWTVGVTNDGELEVIK